MNAISDLNMLAEILTDKGYNGYFHTQGAYPGKLKDSIGEFLESCHKGTDTLPKENLLLTGYLQWSGDEKPRIETTIWVKHQNGEFSLSKMEIVKKDEFGQLLKKTELPDLSIASLPKAFEAIAIVNDQQMNQSPKRFKL